MRTLGGATALTGILVLATWVAGIQRAGAFGAEYVPMAPSTAVLFVFLGAGVMTGLGRGGSWLSRVFPWLLSVSLLAVCLPVLLNYFFGVKIPLTFDRIASYGTTIGDIPLGRMSPLTAAAFLASYLSLVFQSSPKGNRFWRRQAGVFLGVAAFLAGFVVFIGYATGAPLLYDSNVVPMAMVTSITFMALGGALIGFAGPGRWPELMLAGAGGDPVERTWQKGSGPAGVILLLFVVLGAGGVLFIRYQVMNLRAVAQKELAATAAFKADRIASWREEQRSVVELFLRSPSVSDFSRGIVGSATGAGSERAVSWLEDIRKTGGYLRIVLFDAGGKARIALPVSDAGISPPHPDEFNEAMVEGRETAGDLHRDQPDVPGAIRGAHMDIWSPVTGRGGSTGVWLVEVDADPFLEMLIEGWTFSNVSTETYIVGRAGGDIAFLARRRVCDNGDKEQKTLKNLRPSVLAVGGHEGVVDAVDRCNKPVLAAIKKVPGTRWYVIVKETQREIYGPLRSQAMLAGGIVLAALLATFLWTGLLWNRRDNQWLRQQLAAEETRARLEEQLLQAQKMEAIGQLAGGVAHDFNNLLTGIIGNTSLVLSELPKDDPLRQPLEDVSKASRIASGLTRQLLSFSRKQVVELKVLDLNAVTTNVSRILERLLGENIILKISLHESALPVKIDQGQLEQALINMAVNARDAMPDGGELRIATSTVRLDSRFCDLHPGATPGEHALLRISDNGIGMTDDVKRRIFEPFFTTKPRERGTGLGLAMVYGAIRQFGGFVVVESMPGKGSSFGIHLPLVSGDLEQIASLSLKVRAADGTGTILLVEDDQMVRRLVAKVLSKQGYNVIQAATGDEALAAARGVGGVFNLLVTDIMMPGMNGRVLAAGIHAEYPEVKVLFMSGYTDNIIDSEGMPDSGEAFLPKPFTPQELTEKVREVLNSAGV
ncbi:MAG: ATP-binding protein [Myxococcota bacterium]